MKRNWILVGSLFLFLSCGRIPIFNHLNAEDLRPAGTLESAVCSVKLSKVGLCFGMEWIEIATEERKGSFRIRFATETGVAVDPSHQVFVKLWMPSMGHGSSPVTVTQEKTSAGKVIPGSYLATDVFFVMGGAWEIWVQLKDGAKVLDQGKIDYQQ
jgi:hypothetical protein